MVLMRRPWRREEPHAHAPVRRRARDAHDDVARAHDAGDVGLAAGADVRDDRRAELVDGRVACEVDREDAEVRAPLLVLAERQPELVARAAPLDFDELARRLPREPERQVLGAGLQRLPHPLDHRVRERRSFE